MPVMINKHATTREHEYFSKQQRRKRRTIWNPIGQSQLAADEEASDTAFQLRRSRITVFQTRVSIISRVLTPRTRERRQIRNVTNI